MTCLRHLKIIYSSFLSSFHALTMAPILLFVRYCLKGYHRRVEYIPSASLAHLPCGATFLPMRDTTHNLSKIKTRHLGFIVDSRHRVGSTSRGTAKCFPSIGYAVLPRRALSARYLLECATRHLLIILLRIYVGIVQKLL